MMKANVLMGINDLRYQDTPTPKLKDGWVLLKVKAAGICGSDINRVFVTGTYHFPTIIGHEFAGVVADANPEDADLVGKRFSVFPLIPCMECDSCKEGRYETCSHYNYLGSRCDGAFAEYVLVPKWNLLPIDDHITMTSAAMFEPASVGLHALRNVGLNIGESIAIIGPGTIGMILSQLAKISGADKVILIGRTQTKLDFAKDNFDIEVINSAECDVAKRIREITNDKGVDVAIEGTGASPSLETCLDIVRAEGRVLSMGNPLGDMTIAKECYWKLLRKQLRLFGTWNSAFGTTHSDWTIVHQLVSQGKLKLDKLITHVFPLSALLDGLNVMRDKNTFSNKVMIVNDED